MRQTELAAKQPARTADLAGTLGSSIGKIHERFEAQQDALAEIIETQNSIQEALKEAGVEGSIGALAELAEARQSAVERVAKRLHKCADCTAACIDTASPE